jgi:hypothetical protein
VIGNTFSKASRRPSRLAATTTRFATTDSSTTKAPGCGHRANLLIVGNTFADNGGTGFSVSGAGTRVLDNVVTGNGGPGIVVGSAGVRLSNSIYDNASGLTMAAAGASGGGGGGRGATPAVELLEASGSAGDRRDVGVDGRRDDDHRVGLGRAEPRPTPSRSSCHTPPIGTPATSADGARVRNASARRRPRPRRLVGHVQPVHAAERRVWHGPDGRIRRGHVDRRGWHKSKFSRAGGGGPIRGNAGRILGHDERWGRVTTSARAQH